MISIFRAFLGTWAAKAFFLLLIGGFVLWGVGDVFTRRSIDTAVATVGDRRIEMDEVGEAYRRQLSSVTRMLGGQAEPTMEIKRSVAAQALERLITQVALAEAVSAMGLVVPDDALREAVWQTKAFAGPDGKFDRRQFEDVLRNNGLNEARFLALMRTDIGQRQLMAAARAGAASPETMTRLVYAFQQEKRVAEMVELRLDAVRPPAAPEPAVLERWYTNNIDRFSSPEFRRIKAVVLSPDRLAADVVPDDAALHAAYQARAAEFVQPEKRSVEVLLSQDEAKAAKLAETWRAMIAGGHGDWAAVQAAAQAEGASPVALSDARRSEIPAPELAAAIFAAAPEAVVGPVRSALGWHVLRVTKVVAGSTRSFDEVRPQLVAQLQADRAADLLYDHANKVDDLLSGGVPLDELPADLGLAAVSGTLDAQGMTRQGEAAPIPGGDDLRHALIAAVFQAARGEPPRLVEAPRKPGVLSGFFAFVVEDIAPPAPRPYAEVAAKVLADWTQAEIRRTQEAAAAAMLVAIKGGQSLADAAALADLKPRRLPPVSRGAQPGDEVPLQLVNPLFELKQGEPTMVETADGFVVAVLAEILPATPDADPVGYGQVREALTAAMADDVQAAVIAGLRARSRPQVNKVLVDRIVQPE
ncbi:MAG: SurA N-terminal domain-containing protein [Acetobacteraceae bacterium]|nr:SurA N-terminal domain-containing protein [Acetobacteraceae bacterium]